MQTPTSLVRLLRIGVAERNDGRNRPALQAAAKDRGEATRLRLDGSRPGAETQPARRRAGAATPGTSSSERRNVATQVWSDHRLSTTTPASGWNEARMPAISATRTRNHSACADCGSPSPTTPACRTSGRVAKPTRRVRPWLSSAASQAGAVTWGLVPEAQLRHVVVCSPHFDDAARAPYTSSSPTRGATVVTVCGGPPPATRIRRRSGKARRLPRRRRRRRLAGARRTAPR